MNRLLEPSCENDRRYQDTDISESGTLNHLDFNQAPFSSDVPSKGFDFVLCLKADRKETMHASL
ncbi:MAG: hypothetical protein I8H75_00590 [Myxococcaceae bacterium]|nr:hypothetical protein [Myxococcaceae bacterium]MBH2005839.1 hypothetical protein [Myxococcaceae bacterium]